MGSFLFLQKRDRPTEQERERNRAKLQVGRYVKKKKRRRTKKTLISSPPDRQANGQTTRHLGRQKGKQCVILVRSSSTVSSFLDLADGG